MSRQCCACTSWVGHTADRGGRAGCDRENGAALRWHGRLGGLAGTGTAGLLAGSGGLDCRAVPPSSRQCRRGASGAGGRAGHHSASHGGGAGRICGRELAAELWRPCGSSAARAAATDRLRRGPGLHRGRGRGKLHLLFATLGYSRGCMCRRSATSGNRLADGMRAPSVTSAGVLAELLMDNGKALGRARRGDARGGVQRPPAQLCPLWGVRPVACAPYRARTKARTSAVSATSGQRHWAGALPAGGAGGAFGLVDAPSGRVHGTTGEGASRAVCARGAAGPASIGRPSGIPADARADLRVQTDACVDVDNTTTTAFPGG